MIKVESLSKQYGSRRAVDDVSFSIEKGEVVGFLGPNGAGKSTTLRMITGFLAPTSGRVHIGGVDLLADPRAARRLFGYMPEGVPLYPEMRVVEYLSHRAELKEIKRDKRKEAIELALSRANVLDVRTRIVGQLSKGYRQRVGLADALLGDPPLLILDEPTSGLDPNQIRQVRSLIREVAGDKTVLLSTHILPEVEALCDRVVIIKQGKKVGEGAPGDLRGDGRQFLVAIVRTKTRRSASEIEALFADVSHVHSVKATVQGEEEQSLFELRIEADPAPEAAERIFSKTAEAGMFLRQLVKDASRLEDVFSELTMEDPPPAEDAGAEDVEDSEDREDREDSDEREDSEDADAEESNDGKDITGEEEK